MNISCVVLVQPVDILHPFTSLEWKQCREPPWTDGVYSSQAAVFLKDKVYVQLECVIRLLGQRAPARIYIYTPATDTWDSLDTPVYDFVLTTYQSKLVLVGGREYVDEKVEGSPSNKLWTLSEDGKWEETLPPMETACSKASAVSHGDHLIVVNGTMNDVYLYDGHDWAKSQPIPETLKRSNSTLVNDNLYVIGRSSYVYSASLKSLIASCQPSETSQPSTVWKKLSYVPHYDCNHLVAFGNRLVGVGRARRYALYAYSPSNWCWEDLGVIPSFGSKSRWPQSLICVGLPSNEVIAIGEDIVFKAKLYGIINK